GSAGGAQVSRVVVLTGDPIGPRMAGPAIRSWNMASLLAEEHEVTLVTTTRLDEVAAPFALRRIKAGDEKEFRDLESWADVIVFQGHGMDQFETLRRSQKILVADIYDPMHLEMLEQGREQPRATWELMVREATQSLNRQLARADFLLCASERQRMFYLGQLAALGRLNPDTYATDPHLRELLAVAPFGIEELPPAKVGSALRGVIDGFDDDSKVLLWGGGVYSWFDPQTLIRAVASVASRRPNVRLFFLGTRHPGIDEMGVVRESMDLAEELGVLGSSVFFNDDWVEYSKRQSFFVEADAGVSTHHDHVETTFSFRTRILDYLWAGLPMVVTEGDSFAELVERESLGVVVPADDVDALADALDRVLFDEDFVAEVRANVSRVAEEFTWSRTLAPLVEFVRDPHHAADFGSHATRGVMSLSDTPKTGLRRDIARAWHHLRHSGFRVVLGKLRRRWGGQ
ncbi:MAG TPA: glycosyltransferase family 4 protein, partial [Terrimesophilobacter sp.]|nr:glycosyltransferase family 4 protein [Terrimesophilobacter sp.]